MESILIRGCRARGKTTILKKILLSEYMAKEFKGRHKIFYDPTDNTSELLNGLPDKLPHDAHVATRLDDIELIINDLDTSVVVLIDNIHSFIGENYLERGSFMLELAQIKRELGDRVIFVITREFPEPYTKYSHTDEVNLSILLKNLGIAKVYNLGVLDSKVGYTKDVCIYLSNAFNGDIVEHLPMYEWWGFQDENIEANSCK